MKKSFFALAFLSSSIITAEEPLCKTTAGQMLSFSASNTVFIGEEERPYKDMRKSLSEKFVELCKTDKSSNDIISEMYNRCFRLTKEKIKKKESKFHFEKACDIAFIAATYYAEGFEQAKKDNAEITDNSENEIEREIPAGIPERSTLKK
ncbi:MAG: hypothetical protein PHY93_10685 [Bacteriovorax sp.]|nr:hypothetical protein [Bacteriovorax sp.]